MAVKRVVTFIMQSRVNAIMAATIGLLFPLLNIATNSIVGVVALRHGTVNGVLVLVAATVITIAATGWFSSPLVVIVMALTTGLPVLLLAVLLRRSCSLSLSLLGGALLTAAGLLLIEVITGDSLAWWRSLLQRILLPPDSGAEAVALSSEALDVLVPLFTKLPIAVFVASVFALLIARWCHALIDHPGAFADEYRRMRLSSAVAGLALGVGVWAFISDIALVDELMYVVVILFFFQGIAIVHAVVGGRKESQAWVVLMYVMVILVPPSIVMMALIGWSDVWLNYRRRLSSGY